MGLDSWLLFSVVAAIAVFAVIAVQRYWQDKVNLSEEDEALERRISSLNEHQANRRRDDEIVRLLRGDEPRVMGQPRDVEEDR